MKRNVECQDKSHNVIIGRGSTPDTGEFAPEVTKEEVTLLFYDDENDAHRNSYQIKMTVDEAKHFVIGQYYTLTIE